MPRDAIVVPDSVPEPAPATSNVGDSNQTRRDFRLASDLSLAMGPMRGFGGSEVISAPVPNDSLYDDPAYQQPPQIVPVVEAPVSEPLPVYLPVSEPTLRPEPDSSVPQAPSYPLYGLEEPPAAAVATTASLSQSNVDVAYDAAPNVPQGLLPGDMVEVAVYGQPDLSGKGVVAPSGTLSLPLIGAVEVQGLSDEQAAERIEQALQSGGFVVAPQVTVAVQQDNKGQQVSVLGEVKAPGRYALEAGNTLLDIIAQARGLQETASDAVVVLRRLGNSTRRHYVDLAGLLRSDSEQPSFELRPNDIIVVPEVQQFYIYGEVRRPDVYKLRPGMTIMQALSISGGLNERGSDKRIEIRRRGNDGRGVSHEANLGDVLQSDDVIYVKERLF